MSVPATTSADPILAHIGATRSMLQSECSTARVCVLALALALVTISIGATTRAGSIVIDGHRYYALDDDQMIAMRYARNLAGGQGLVWNPGERVEGYTS